MDAVPVDEATALQLIHGWGIPGNGDDAFVFGGSARELCTSVDTTIAGVHAPLDLPPELLGRRAAARTR